MSDNQNLVAHNPQERTSKPVSDKLLQPIDPGVLVDLLTPALALVGASGMSMADREEWMMAAGIVLQHLPEDLVRRGVKVAMQTVDHPSKIVAAIIADAKSDLAFRQRTKPEPKVEQTALPAPGQNRMTHAEIDEIKAEFGIGIDPEASEPRYLGPPRNPTVADYVRMGVPREDAEVAVRGLLPAPTRKETAKQIGNVLP